MSALIRALTESARHLREDPDAARRTAVLVTGAGGSVGSALAVELASRGFTVHGADHRPAAPAVGSVPGLVWHVLPRYDDPAYLPTLRRIVARHGVSIVVPTLDEELPVLASVRHWPEAGVLVVVAGPGPVGLTQDKLLMTWQLAGHGVPTPRCASPSDFPDTAAALDSMGHAIVIRLRRSGRRGGGSRVLLRAEDVDWDRLDDDFVVQEFIPGREYTCMLYRPEGSAARAALIFERLRPAPADGLRPCPPGQADDVERTAWAAIRALGVTGPAEVVLRRSSDGTVRVLSVHPRFSRHSGELLDRMLSQQLPTPRSSPDVGADETSVTRSRPRPRLVATSHADGPGVASGTDG